MTEQAVETGYRTVAELAEYLGISVFTVRRKVQLGLWKGSRTGTSSRSPLRFSPAQTAAIEALMERNGEPEAAAAPSQDERAALIDLGMRRLKRSR